MDPTVVPGFHALGIRVWEGLHHIMLGGVRPSVEARSGPAALARELGEQG